MIGLDRVRPQRAGRLDENGVTMQSNREVKQRLGFSDVQLFSPATASVARAVSAAVGPEDCDQ